MQRYLMILLSFFLFSVNNGKAAVTHKSSNKEIATECLAQCHASYRQSSDLTSFNFPLFAEVLRDARPGEKPETCEGLSDALTFSKRDGQASGVSNTPCFEACSKILSQTCGTSLG
jgi:hypothetical protein